MAKWLVVVCLLSLYSCSEYSVAVKSDDYQQKFVVANKMYDKNSFLKATALYEQVYQRTPKTKEGEVSYYRLGRSYFFIEDYYLGAYYLSSFSEKYPNSDKCEETSFLNALCQVKNSPKSSLDQGETQAALNELQLFIYKYPSSSRIDTCNQIMDMLRLKLENKDFESLLLYDKTENYKSAVVVSETFLKDFPESKQKEIVWDILLKNSYHLAVHSVEDKKNERIDKTIERYRKFALEFPNSIFVEKYKNKMIELQEHKLNQP